MKLSLLSLASLLFLVFAGWQAVGTLSRTPAFNRSLQVEAAAGGRIPRFTEAMYDRAAYNYRIALEWYYQTFTASLPGEEGSVLQKAALEDRFRRVLDAAVESLRHSPGDPFAWMLVARAEAAFGNRERALEAYLRSFDLAPHNALRAVDRMQFLIQFMSETEGRDLALATIPPAAVHSDLQTMKMMIRLQAFAEQLSINPVIIAFQDEHVGETRPD